jgi:hypothetical protein
MLSAAILRNPLKRNRTHCAVLTFQFPNDTGARLWWGVWHDDAMFLACAFGRIWRLDINRQGVRFGPMLKAI